jgi:hypothetical protein
MAGMVMFALSVLAALAPAGPAARPAIPAAPRARLVLTFEMRTPETPPSRRVVSAAIEELTAIWAPYAVGIELAGGAPCNAGTDATHLSIAIHGGIAEPAAWAAPLAAVRFSEDGVPEPVISVFYGELVRLVTSTPFMEKRGTEWPSSVRDQLVGRALGRVLAHEIGNFLLRLHDHTGGLMRARHPVPALIDPDRRAFRLTPADAGRLRALLASDGPVARTAAAPACGS